MLKKIICNLLEKIYPLLSNKFKTKIENIFKKIDGGEFFSKYLRKIYKKHYNLVIGIGSYGCFKIKNFPQGTIIGNYCSIAEGVKYLNGNHPKDFISTHPMFYNKTLKFVKEDKITRSQLEIGHDVWIGYNVIILPNVTKIGTGSIIGAGSIVTKNVDDYGIYVGVPAKKIGQRFSNEEIKKIKKTKWWEYQPDKLKNYIKEFENKNLFFKNFK